MEKKERRGREGKFKLKENGSNNQFQLKLLDEDPDLYVKSTSLVEKRLIWKVHEIILISVVCSWSVTLF